MLKEAQFQGISYEEAVAEHERAEQEAEQARKEAALRPKPTRQAKPEKKEPAEEFGTAKEESEQHGEWGSGDKGYKVPQTPGERLRSAWLLFLWF